MLQETFQFQKDLCESTFSIATAVQENCETLLKDTLELTPWVPAEGKNAYLFWSEQYWSTLANLKGSSLMSIEYLEKIITPQKSQDKKSPTAKKTGVVPQVKASAAPAKSEIKAKAPAKKTTRAKSTGTKKKTTPASTSAKKAATAKKSTSVKAAPKKSPAVKTQQTKKADSLQPTGNQSVTPQVTAKKSGDAESKVS